MLKEVIRKRISKWVATGEKRLLADKGESGKRVGAGVPGILFRHGVNLLRWGKDASHICTSMSCF